MNVQEVTSTGVVVTLTSNDLMIMCNALNEVCNGLDILEFATRMGVNKEEALALMKTLGSVYERVLHHQESE